MVLKHVWGLFTDPKNEWVAIRDDECTIGKCYAVHVLILAAVPAISGFIGTTQFGWQIGAGDPVKRTMESAGLISALYYMAMLVGVDVNRVISVTFIVGSATAAIGGVLIASHTGQINYYIGFIAGIKAFVAAVLGGIGSVPGAVLGSLVLGWTESFFTGYISSDYEDVFAFVFLVLILIFRPAGILGRSDTDKV